MTTLPEDQKAFYTAEFNKCAKNGMISDINAFAKLMRALGQNLNPADLSKMMGGAVSLQKFLDLIGGSVAKEDTREDILEAFKVYDKDGNGLIMMSDLRYILSNQGDKLDGDQAEQICARISTTNGAFNYHTLVEQFSKMAQR